MFISNIITLIVSRLDINDNDLSMSHNLPQSVLHVTVCNEYMRQRIIIHIWHKPFLIYYLLDKKTTYKLFEPHNRIPCVCTNFSIQLADNGPSKTFINVPKSHFICVIRRCSRFMYLHTKILFWFQPYLAGSIYRYRIYSRFHMKDCLCVLNKTGYHGDL